MASPACWVSMDIQPAALLRSVALAAAALGLLLTAVPASVLAATTASAPVLTQAMPHRHAQASTRSRSALSRAVFASPRLQQPLQKLAISTDAQPQPEMKPKAEWTSDEGFSFTGARLGYKARF